MRPARADILMCRLFVCQPLIPQIAPSNHSSHRHLLHFLLLLWLRLLPDFGSFGITGFLAVKSAVFPPENGAKHKDHELGPRSHQPVFRRQMKFPMSLLPIVADLKKALRVVCTNSVKPFTNSPSHFILIIDRPCVHRPALPSCILDKARSKVRNNESLLKHVEGHVVRTEELPRIGCREAYVSDSEVGKIFSA